MLRYNKRSRNKNLELSNPSYYRVPICNSCKVAERSAEGEHACMGVVRLTVSGDLYHEP